MKTQPVVNVVTKGHIDHDKPYEASAPDLNDLLAAYWDIAYTEGIDGRTHDIVDDAAQKTLSDISNEINRLVEQSHMAGQFNAGIDPSYSEARVYRIELLNN